MLKNIIKKLAPLALLVLVALIYANVFGAPFVFDDIVYIVENTFIRDISNFYSLSGTRYIVFLSFALNYAVGGLSPAGYHCVNIVIHALNSILVYLLVGGLFGSLTFRAEGYGAEGNEAGRGLGGAGFYLAFMTALIFAAHPIQTEAVAYVSQRFASLAAFFYLLSVVCYIRSRLAFIDRRRRAGLALYCLAFISGLLAQKSKETAFTLPAVIILVEFLFFQKGRLFLKKGFFAIPFIGLFAIIPMELFYLGKGGGAGSIAGKLRLLQLEELATLSRVDYLLTQFRVIVTYIRLLFFPVGQRGDYDYAIYHSFFTAPVFFSFVFLLIIFALAVYFALRSARKGHVFGLMAAFGILWFFITISVESSIVPIKDVIFEHRVYLPSSGVFLCFTSAYFYLAQRGGRRARAGRGHILGVIIGPLIIVLALSVLTYRRNRVWTSDLLFWGDVVSKSPQKARGYNNLGNVYYNRGQVRDAVTLYRKAISLKKNDYEAYNNLGSALLALNRPGDALGYFSRAIELRPDYTAALSNMALVLVALNRPGEALGYARFALAARPGFAGAHNALGMALVDSGNMERGLTHLAEAVRLNPASADFANNLGLALFRAGRYRDAAVMLKKAVTLGPADRMFRENLEMAREALKGGRGGKGGSPFSR